MQGAIQAEDKITKQYYAIASINNNHYINLSAKLSPFSWDDFAGKGQLCCDESSTDGKEDIPVDPTKALQPCESSSRRQER
jgi:hypothetical protein